MAGPYCCAGKYVSPSACSAGSNRGASILKTQYVQTVRDLCPDAYAYAHDDTIATIACETTTNYTLTFYCLS